MDDGTLLLSALHARPGDDLAWLAFADWLKETGRPAPAEMARNLALIRRDRHFPNLIIPREQRVRELLAASSLPVVPTITNTIGMIFALIPPATFMMGSPQSEPGRYSDETPLHAVTLTRPYYLGIHPVTQAQYAALMRHNPSNFCRDGEDANIVGLRDTSAFPIEGISWQEAVAFCSNLGKLPAEHIAGRSYRLPTEAEWEHACRGGIFTPSPYHFGNELSPRQACHNFLETMPEKEELPGIVYEPCQAPVCSYPPNAFGLHDLHCNIWEYCSDWFVADYYEQSPASDPTGPATGDSRVLRGGSWYSRPSVCRTACRNPIANLNTSGFRVVLEHRG